MSCDSCDRCDAVTLRMILRVTPKTIMRTLTTLTYSHGHNSQTRHPTAGSGQAAELSLSGCVCQARCSS
jgi:hypothetical protein